MKKAKNNSLSSLITSSRTELTEKLFSDVDTDSSEEFGSVWKRFTIYPPSGFLLLFLLLFCYSFCYSFFSSNEALETLILYYLELTTLKPLHARFKYYHFLLYNFCQNHRHIIDWPTQQSYDECIHEKRRTVLTIREFYQDFALILTEYEKLEKIQQFS